VAVEVRHCYLIHGASVRWGELQQERSSVKDMCGHIAFQAVWFGNAKYVSVFVDLAKRLTLSAMNKRTLATSPRTRVCLTQSLCDGHV
jgi:hypothetical protein